MSFVSVDNIVREACASLGDPSAQKTYVPVLREVLSSMEYLGLFSIPMVISSTFKVEDNLTVILPNDAIDVFFVGKILSVSSKQCMYPLIEAHSNRPDIEYATHSFGCNETDEDTQPSGDCFCFENFNDSGSAELYNYYPYYYGELYGRPNQVVFGTWEYFSDHNKIAFAHGMCINAGDTVAVKYKSTTCGAANRLVPVQQKMMIRYHAMMNYYSASNPGKSRYFLDLFMRSERDYRKNKNYTQAQTIIDAFTSSYNSSL